MRQLQCRNSGSASEEPLPRSQATILDYGTDEGKKLYTELEQKFLPLLLFDETVKEALNLKRSSVSWFP